MVDESYLMLAKLGTFSAVKPERKLLLFLPLQMKWSSLHRVVSDESKATLQDIIRDQVYFKVLSTRTAGAATMAWST